MTTPLDTLSPLDGRYQAHSAPLTAYFSERALIRERALVELAWLKTLAPLFDFSAVADLSALDDIATAATQPGMAEAVKETEKTLRHDVKAVEYWLCEQLQQRQLGVLRSLVHFGCTSWDINNLAMSRMIGGALNSIMIPQLQSVVDSLNQRATAFADFPMLSRTHGQPASPTTVGKEFANFSARLSPRLGTLSGWRMTGKMNGAVGNYNAHMLARPDIDWPTLARTFVERQNMKFATHTTQIEPYDDLADLFNLLRSINNILLDFCRDIWGYIALDYFCQQAVAHEVGSSTMPHKINPIDFENAEGNIGAANALLVHFSDKLPVSRWQRDLSDSTLLRNIGVAFGHTLLAWEALCTGLARLTLNTQKLDADLDANWQILTEAVQTVLRAENAAADGYEQLKDFSRGAAINAAQLHDFIKQLPVSGAAKKRLLTLTPRDYYGLAAKLARAQ